MRKTLFKNGSFEITKREVIACVSIIAVMLIVGLVISDKISEWQLDKNEVYNKAVKIETSDLFQYGMETNIGNAFVYGELKAVDTVTYPEIGGKYMFVEKVKEKYTRHTRTKTYTDSKGKRHTKTEVYYSWDYADSENLTCKEITFCDTMFASDKICLPSTYYIDTIKESSKIRYKYYGVNTSYAGTIFTDLRDNTISNNSPFYSGMNISTTMDYITSSDDVVLVVYWIVWIGLIALIIFLFFKAENKWLE